MGRLVVCAILLSSSSAMADRAAVPFYSEISAIEEVHTSGDVSPCPIWKATHTVTGVATHLGQMTATMSDCIDPRGFPSLRFDQGVMTMTAADGDELAGSYEGRASVVDACTVEFTAFLEWQGGTGRFSDATGSAISNGVIDLCGGNGWNTWEATTVGDITFGPAAADARPTAAVQTASEDIAPPDQKGPYNVGIRFFQNVPVSGVPLARILVYYPTDPALVQPNCLTRYTIQGVGGSYQRTSPLCAVELAEPAPGRFPMVIHDHGGGGAGADAQMIGQLPVHETLASHGFVVVAIRHSANATARVKDIPKVIDFMTKSDNPLSASIDTDRIGMSGFSTGGRTSLAVTGGWAAQGLVADPRIKAMVLYEPGRDSALSDVATISIPYLMIGGTRFVNGVVTVPEVFDTTVLATPRIRVRIPEAIHFSFQTDLCQAIEETREAALAGDPSLRDPVTNKLVREPLTNLITNPLTGLRACNPAMSAAGNQACVFWNQGELIVPALGGPIPAFAFGGGRNLCTRIGVNSNASLDVDPVDGLTDDFVPGTDIRLFEGNDAFDSNASTTEPPIPAELSVPLVKLYTVAFFQKFLQGDGRTMRYLTPGYADVQGLEATVEIRE